MQGDDENGMGSDVFPKPLLTHIDGTAGTDTDIEHANMMDDDTGLRGDASEDENGMGNDVFPRPLLTHRHIDGTAGTDADIEHASTADDGTGFRSDEESDGESEISAGPQLEPRCWTHSAETPVQDTAAAETDDNDLVQADRDMTRGARGLAESQLEQQPFVVPYPSQRVGDLAHATVSGQSAHANTSYELEIAQDEMNPYAPFASQLDWEIAKWAKLHGPGFTEFGKLMAIPKVCSSHAV